MFAKLIAYVSVGSIFKKGIIKQNKIELLYFILNKVFKLHRTPRFIMKTARIQQSLRSAKHIQL